MAKKYVFLKECADCQFFSVGQWGSSDCDTTREKFSEITADTEGFCRFNPPVSSGVLEDDDGCRYPDIANWPKVFGGDWCGKFKCHEFSNQPQKAMEYLS